MKFKLDTRPKILLHYILLAVVLTLASPFLMPFYANAVTAVIVLSILLFISDQIIHNVLGVD